MGAAVVLAVAVAVAVFVWRPWAADGPATGAPAEHGPATVEGDGAAAAAHEAANPLAPETADASGATAGESTVATATENEDRRVAATVADAVVFEVTCAGAPLRAAQVAIAPVLRDPVWEGSNEEHSYEREQLAGVFVPLDVLARLETDGDGLCAHPLSTLVEAGRPIVVAVQHERAFGEVRELDLAALASSPRVVIDLEPAPPSRAIVSGAEPGAEVVLVQSALYSDFREVDDFTNVFVSRPLLRTTHTRVGDGDVVLFPVKGRSAVLARSGARSAAPYIGALDGDLAVELGATFTLEGAIEGHPHTLHDGLVRVQALDPSTGAWLDRGLGSIAGDGAIAPIDVAWQPDADGWRVRAEAVDLLSLEAPIAPAPDASVQVVLYAHVQTFLDVRVFDAVTGAPVPGAGVSVDWEQRAEPTWLEPTDEAGRASFRHLPAGVLCTYSAECDGYAPSGPIRYIAEITQVNRVLPVHLWPQTVIVAEIVPPVAGNETWRGEMKRLAPDRSNPLPVDLVAQDGRFELRGLGGDQLSLFLASERGTLGPLEIVAAPGRVELGRLEITPYAVAEVRVRDAATGEPVAGASVTAHARIADGTEAAVAGAATSDELGFARLERFPVGDGWLLVEAPRYASQWLEVPDQRDGVVDFGEVLLELDRAVTVELGERVATPERFAVGVVDAPHERARFDGLGRAVLASAPDAWHLELFDPQGRSERLRLLDSVRALGEHYVWPMRAGSLDVEVRNWPKVEAGDSVPMHTLELSWREPLGTFDRFLPVGPGLPFVPARALPVDSVRFTLVHPSGEAIAWGRADLPPVGDQRISIDASIGSTTLRVVDVDGQPLGGIDVVAFDRRSTTSFNVAGTTTTRDDGTARVPFLDGGELGVTLLGPSDQIVQEVDTSDWRVGRVHDVVFAPTGWLELLVVDGTGAEALPVAGAAIEVRRGDDAFRLAGLETDGAGRSTPVRAQPGAYLVVVSKPGHWSRRVALDVVDGAVPATEVLLPELARLALRLVDGSGAPLANRSVDLWHAGLGESCGDWLAAGSVRGSTVTDLAGRLVLDGVPAGAYTVSMGGFEVGQVVAAAGAEAGATTLVAR